MPQFSACKCLVNNPKLMLSSTGFSFHKIHNTFPVEKCHYEVLGVDCKASQSEIKSAYYELSKKYHPDKKEKMNSQDVNTKSKYKSTYKFIELTESYGVLNDISRRKEYDKSINFSQTLIMKEAERFGKSDANFNSNVNTKIHYRKTFSSEYIRNSTVYDFDAWTRAHYQDSFKRKKEMEINRAKYEKYINKPHINKKNPENWAIVMLTLFVISAVITENLVTSYDITNSDSIKSK